MNLIYQNGLLTCGAAQYACQIGQGGLIVAAEKREGDGATPLGTWPLRALFYRADRIELSTLALPARAITQNMAWQDDPAASNYNQLFSSEDKHHPERLWREDAAYDVIIVLGYNDNPAIAGKGSAIFLHVAHANNRPTAGCLALSLADMLKLVPQLTKASAVEIKL